MLQEMLNILYAITRKPLGGVMDHYGILDI
jgi:hypothetical protein